MLIQLNTLRRFSGIAFLSFAWLIPSGAWAQTANGGGVTARATPVEQIKASMEKAEASMQAYWQGINQDHSLKYFLIQSKLDLVDADIDKFVAKDSPQAVIDLQECQYYVKQAIDNAQTHLTDGVTKRHLAAIEKQIIELRSFPQLAKQQPRYKSLEHQIQKVITVL